jgi:pimeloyl-ACP methyl ester carboxylesterase
LLITHGWPGSISEFTKIIGPLTNPRAHGGDPADAFHIVAPSMPGYGFSEAPRQPGCGARQVAQRVAELMAGLGYERYFAQGGDWGSAVSTWIAVEDAAHVAAIHLNLVFVRQPKEGAGGATDAELARMKERAGHMREGVGYQAIQGTKPQTLGYALNDSPAGLAGWIGEKFHGWTQHDGDHEKAVSRDELLTNVTIYWVTQTATSAARLYYENGHVGDRYPERIETPTCVALFPGELALPPRAWVEAQYNVVHWQEQARGGHFAALEAPELLVADIRNAFRRLR